MRELKFTKMQSLGNDFVMLDSVTEDIRITEDIARNIALIAQSRVETTATRPTPLYVRPANAAPSREAPPVLLD